MANPIRRPTITDLAAAAGVSVATVDRVLNERSPVRQGTAERVLQAADALGFHAAPLLRRRVQPDLPRRKLGFLLQRESETFYRMLGEGLAAATEAAPGMRGRAQVTFMTDLSPQAIARALREMGPQVDAVGFVAQDHPHVSEAVTALRARGVPCFALLSDIATEQRAGYVGVDNRKMGRTAGWMVARAARRPGKVAVLLGSHRYLGQEVRESGFRSYLREHAPDLTLLETVINLDDREIAHEAALAILDRHPDLAALYVAGGGSEGVIAALREVESDRRPALACNEMTPASRAALIDEVATVVLSTPVGPLAARAVEAMAAAIGAPQTAPARIILPFDLFVSENLP